jgi:hypothetical protein
MKPIYTNKGCTTDPQHFRSITVLSCLGKVFTSILSERLTQYSDKFLVLCENQSGFRKGNLFILHAKRNGGKFSPCLTPLLHGKNSDIEFLYTIRDFVSLYIFTITNFS